jgi:hypothetical protein
MLETKRSNLNLLHSNPLTNWETSIEHLGKKGVIFGEIFMRIGIHDSIGRVGDSKIPGGALSVCNVVGATISEKMGRLVYDGPSLSHYQLGIECQW